MGASDCDDALHIASPPIPRNPLHKRSHSDESPITKWSRWLDDIVALVASAGGHVAIPTLLRDLPADFDVPIVVMQHLGPDATGTLKVYGRSLPFAVEWAASGSALAPRGSERP